MVMAIATGRVQTLTRLINKCNLQLTLLTQQQQTLSQMSSEIGRQYKQCYAYVNGVYGTISAEQEDTFTNKLKQLEPVYYMITEKDDDLDIQISLLETQLQAYTKELDSAKTLNEESAKKEVPHLSM